MNWKRKAILAALEHTPLFDWLRRGPKLRLLILIVCSGTLGGVLDLAMHSLLH